MISRKKSIRERSDVINQYYKNMFDRKPTIEKNEIIRKKGKKRKLTRMKKKTTYRKTKYGETKKKPKP
jgi:hypothetical protein